MGRKSKVDLIPQAAREALQAWLADPAVSQAQAAEAVNALLEEMGRAERLSVAGVNRYAMKMNEVGRRLQERHRVAEMWVNKFGRMPQGKMGQLIVQMVHGLAFDVGLQLGQTDLDPEQMPATVRMLKDLGTMLERTERASSLNAAREAAVKREAAAEAADAAEAEAGRQGVSEQGIEALRAAILQGLDA